MITLLEYINGSAGLKIAAYGTSEGLEKAWESRPRAVAAPSATATIFMHQEDVPKDTRYMQLALNVHGIPLLFENDENLVWNWSDDKKTLHIENLETKPDAEMGFSQKEVYEVPAEHIKEWAPVPQSNVQLWKN